MAHNPYAQDQDESVEMASPACYMGIVDWDYGFDEFFSDSIAKKRRSCPNDPANSPAPHCSKSSSAQQSASFCSNPSQAAAAAAASTENASSSSSSSSVAQGTQPGTESASSRSKASSVSGDGEEQQQQQQQEQRQEQQQQQQEQEQGQKHASNEAYGTTESFSDGGGSGHNGDFGDFEDFEDFGDFEAFDDKRDGHAFGALVEAWSTVLGQVYLEDKAGLGGEYGEWASSHGPKTIRHYVLEEAHESVHSKLTWTSVTYAMDHDTGAPRVKWPRSKIEKMYLTSMKYERVETTAPLVPAILSVDDEDMSGDEDVFHNEAKVQPVHAQETQAESAPAKPAAGASVKSPIFGFSFARFLPRLSTTSLPRSDTSAPTSSTSTQRQSLESIPRTSDATGFSSPTDYHQSPAPSPTPHTPPTQLINATDDAFDDDFDLQQPKVHEKRYSSPVTSWAPPPEKPKPHRRSMMVNTVLANKSFSLLDLDDAPAPPLVATPPPSSTSFSFSPLVPTPTSFPPTPKREQNLLDCTTTYEKDLLEFGEFAPEPQDDFGDFVVSNQEPWGDWKASNTSPIFN